MKAAQADRICMSALQIIDGYRVIITEPKGSVKGRKPLIRDSRSGFFFRTALQD